jgi:hypothetical protein
MSPSEPLDAPREELKPPAATCFPSSPLRIKP